MTSYVFDQLTETTFTAGSESLVEHLIRSLTERPEEWRAGEYTVDHRSGLMLWTKGGVFNLRVWRPFEKRFRLWERLLLSRAIEQQKEAQALSMLLASTDQSKP